MELIYPFLKMNSWKTGPDLKLKHGKNTMSHLLYLKLYAQNFIKTQNEMFLS